MPTAAGIVNESLELIAAQTTVSGNNPTFDGSLAGNAAGVLYTPTVQLLLRQMDPAFARRTAALASAGGGAIQPWANKWAYPADCLRLRQVRPLTYAANDPQPIRAAVIFDGSAKVIVSTIAAAYAVYTSSAPTESIWDSAFAEAVARRLANPLAMALAGRPDFARELLEESERYAQAAELVDEI